MTVSESLLVFIHPRLCPPITMSEPPKPAEEINHTSAAVLLRLKETDTENQQLKSQMAQMQQDAKSKVSHHCVHRPSTLA